MQRIDLIDDVWRKIFCLLTTTKRAPLAQVRYDLSRFIIYLVQNIEAGAAYHLLINSVFN